MILILRLQIVTAHSCIRSFTWTSNFKHFIHQMQQVLCFASHRMKTVLCKAGDEVLFLGTHFSHIVWTLWHLQCCKTCKLKLGQMSRINLDRLELLCFSSLSLAKPRWKNNNCLTWARGFYECDRYFIDFNSSFVFLVWRLMVSNHWLHKM